MNPALLFQLLPLTGRIKSALETIERLEKDPAVQDAIKVFEEAASILATAQKQDATGIQGGQ